LWNQYFLFKRQVELQKKSHDVFSFILMAAILFSLSWLAQSSLTFFSNDTGLRFLQIRELIDHHWQTFAVDYPARSLDPDLAYPPFYYAYSLLNGEFYLQIAPFLPLLTSFAYAVIGRWGLPLLPVLGGVLTAVATYKLGILAQAKYPRLLFWSTVFTTPVLFYSLELWDHTLATACALWAVYGLAHGVLSGRWQSIVWGGVAAGLGLGQRPEMYVFAIALAVGLLLTPWRRWRYWAAYIGGGILGTLPIWWLQFRWVGHPLGMAFAPHFFGYGKPKAYPVEAYSGVTITPAIKTGRLLLYIESHDPITFSAALLILIGAFVMIFALRIPRWRQRRWLWSGLALSGVGYSLFMWQSWSNLLPGVLTTFPLFSLALAYVDRADDPLPTRPVYQLVFSTMLAFLGIMLVIWPAFGGEQWGARYLLPVYPLLLLLAFYVVTVWERPLSSTITTTAAGLLLLGLLMQLFGIRYLFIKHQEQIEDKITVASLPATLILTNSPFLPSFMAALDDKLFMYVENEQDVIELIPRMQHNQIERFALVLVTGRPIPVPNHVGDVSLQEIQPFVYQLE
jgi:membrane protein YdbS with pleckstrin-like domain